MAPFEIDDKLKFVGHLFPLKYNPIVLIQHVPVLITTQDLKGADYDS